MKLYNGQSDHPESLLLLFFVILVGLSALDVATTSIALTSTMNSEGNPLMASILPFAPMVKMVYLFGIFIISDYIDHRRKNSGKYLLAVCCVIVLFIVANNILILGGIYL